MKRGAENFGIELRGAGSGEKFGIDEIVSLYRLRGSNRDGTREHGAGEGEGVELSTFAAGIDSGGQIGEQSCVEGAAGEG